jgi:hypothetical protein
VSGAAHAKWAPIATEVRATPARRKLASDGAGLPAWAPLGGYSA